MQPTDTGAHSMKRLGVLLLTLPLSACGFISNAHDDPGPEYSGTHVSSPSPSTAAAPSQPVEVSGDDLLPSSTAAAWVTYADHLVSVSVISEQRIAPTAEEVAAGEGLIGRQVTLSTGPVLWSRSGAPAAVPATLTWDAGGWNFHGDSERPLHYDGVPSLIPGQRYLIPVTYTALTPGGTKTWLPLSGTAMLPFDDGVIGHGEVIKSRNAEYKGNSSGETPLRDSVWGQGPQALVATLRATPPDPAALKYMSQDAAARYQSVVRDAAGGSTGTPGPGEK